MNHFHLMPKVWYNAGQEGEMEIQEQTRDGILILHIDGQIDSTTGPELGSRLDTKINTGQVHLVLDLSDVPYISSAGLRALSIALKAVRAPAIGGDLCLARLSETVAHAFRISGFNQVFSIYDTVSEAIAVLNASKPTPS
jgi:anti-anti-sigma factor